jgi:hypothetical protein
LKPGDDLDEPEKPVHEQAAPIGEGHSKKKK